MGRMDALALIMSIFLDKDTARAILLVYPFNLIGDDLCSFVLGNPAVFALALVFWMLSAFRILVNPDQGSLDPVGRIGTLFVGKREGGWLRFEVGC